VTFRAGKNNPCGLEVEVGQLQQSTWVGSTGSTHGTHVASTILGYNYYSNFDAAGGFPLPPIQVRGIAPDVTVIPVRVLADFIYTLGTHNRYAALAGLKHTHVLVLSGDADRMTQFSHAERIAVELPDAELVRVRGAGHMVMLEEAQTVNDHLVMLLQQCAYGRESGRKRWWRRG